MSTARRALAGYPPVGGARAACRRGDALCDSNLATAGEQSPPGVDATAADPTRLFRVPAVPLTLLAQSTDTTISNPGGVEHPQSAIGFACAVRSGTTSCQLGSAVCHQAGGAKSLAREAPSFPGQASLEREAIAKGGSARRSDASDRDGWSKLGGAHGRRLKLMAQFQAQVPDPL